MSVLAEVFWLSSFWRRSSEAAEWTQYFIDWLIKSKLFWLVKREQFYLGTGLYWSQKWLAIVWVFFWGIEEFLVVFWEVEGFSTSEYWVFLSTGLQECTDGSASRRMVSQDRLGEAAQDWRNIWVFLGMLSHIFGKGCPACAHQQCLLCQIRVVQRKQFGNASVLSLLDRRSEFVLLMFEEWSWWSQSWLILRRSLCCFWSR
jgi:hypothetical protein